METSQTSSTVKHFHLEASNFLKHLLLWTLTATYGLVIFSLVVAVVVLPFGRLQTTAVEPAWLGPLIGHFDLLDPFLFIIFGPAIGVSLIATVIVLLTTPSVYRWLRIGVNDLIDGQHDDVFGLMAHVRLHLETMNAPQTLLPTITATIAQTLKLPYVAIAAQDGEAPLESVYGAVPPKAEVERLPLRYHETKIGELSVAARRADEPLSQADLQVLEDLARQVGIALYAAQMTADLQQSRTRLVTAREEERRRIRRDLHDGLGPTLASFAMRLEQARESLPPGAEESAALLAALTTEAQNTITDVRRLVYQLRPPDLDEYGLVSALREYLHRMQPKGTTITLVAPDTLPTLPAAVEVAAYRIVQEAVNNALKYAQTSRITVTLTIHPVSISPHALVVTICDQGVGLPVNHAVGIGLHSMHERAEELGGRCVIGNRAEGGVQVVSTLPFG